MRIIEKIQNQIEMLYGIGVPERAPDYLIKREEALEIMSHPEHAKIPKELLLVRKPQDDEVEVALFLDQALLKNLDENDPFVTLNDKNVSDFCILIEGISHFVYYLWKAYQNQPITQLEMELQAEIDKFFMFYFYLCADQDEELCHQIFDILFENFSLIDNLPEESEERYLTASNLASRFCFKLTNQFGPQNKEELIEAIRNFYPLTQEQKIREITH